MKISVEPSTSSVPVGEMPFARTGAPRGGVLTARTQLVEVLIASGIPENGFSVGADRDEALCFIAAEAHVEIYYSERGLRTGVQHYVDENSACAAFLLRMLAMLRECVLEG